MIIVNPEAAAQLDEIEEFLKESLTFALRLDDKRRINSQLDALSFTVLLTPANKFLVTCRVIKSPAPYYDGTVVRMDERYLSSVSEVRGFLWESLAQYNETHGVNVSDQVLAA